MRLSRLIIALALIGMCIGVLILFFAPVVHFAFTIDEAKSRFRSRSAEARETIEFVYGYYLRHHKWPTEAETTQMAVKPLPPEWHYESHPDGPIIYCQGPHHMTIAYYFSPPIRGKIANEWVLSVEGTKERFSFEHEYTANTF